MALQLLPDLRCRFSNGEQRVSPVRASLRFYFETRGVVVSHTVNDTVGHIISRITTPVRIDKLGTPRQLDRSLTLRHAVAPRYPAAFQEASGARVTLEFLIDETGRVRMPVLHAGDNHLLANAAAAALLDWQFAPATRQGEPVIVSARQEFVFPAKL
jgi:TonB family protein